MRRLRRIAIYSIANVLLPNSCILDFLNCRVIVYLIWMMQRILKFWAFLPVISVRYAWQMSRWFFLLSLTGNRLLYGGYFLQAELTKLSHNRHCSSLPRGEINCVVQIPHNDREKLQNSTRVRIGPL